MKNNKPRILCFDIESSFNLVYSFDLYPDFIGHNNIVQERHIYCIAYKWYGSKKVHTISILDDPKRFKKDNHDDYHVCSEFMKVLEEADAVVAHYGDKFDVPMLNARLIKNGLSPFPKVTQIDTKKLASRYFRFNSNRLDYLAKFFGHEGKMENPKDLWQKCFVGDVKAIKHMVKYCKQDIVSLELVFDKLMPFVKNHSLNMGMFIKGVRCTNPTCGSTNIQWRGYNTTKTARYRRFQCQDCGQWGNERSALKDIKVEVK